MYKGTYICIYTHICIHIYICIHIHTDSHEPLFNIFYKITRVILINYFNTVLECLQSFQNFSLNVTIVHQTLREKDHALDFCAPMPKRHTFTRLLNLKGKWLKSETASVYSPSYLAKKCQGPYQRMHVPLIEQPAKTSLWLKEVGLYLRYLWHWNSLKEAKWSKTHKTFIAY